MSESLSVTIIQSNLHWENVDENLSMFSENISSIKEETDIVVLPEMFNTGFSMESAKLAETMEGKSVQWMMKTAKKKNVVIVGSLIIQDGGEFFNRLIWAGPDGKYHTYDKRHLFRMAGEHHHFSSGQERLIIEYKGWKICPLICYDLRFPVWARNTTLKDGRAVPAYDCLIYIANWPEARRTPWGKLLEARAIENQTFVVGVNRIGKDGMGISYSGDSVVIDPKGEILSGTKPFESSIETVKLCLKELSDFREKFPVSMDADHFQVI